MSGTCLIHPSTTNEEIERMRQEVRPHYQAMKLLGAGGGGYAFFVSESADAAARLKDAAFFLPSRWRYLGLC